MNLAHLEANLWRRLFLKTKIYKNINAKEIAKRVFARFRDWQNEGFKPCEVALIYPMLGRGRRDCILLFSIFDIFMGNNFLFRHSYGQGKIATKFPAKYSPSIVAFDSGESNRAVNLITAMSSQGYHINVLLWSWIVLNLLPGLKNRKLLICFTLV